MSRSAIPRVSFGVARGLDRDRQHPDQRAVIQRAGQLVQARRLEQLVGLAQDASLGGPEHEVQGDGRQGPGEQRDDHDLSTQLIEVAEDGRRISPDPDDRDDLRRRT